VIAPIEEDYKTGLDLSLWRKLFAYTKPYRRSVWMLAGAGVAMAGLDICFPLFARAVIDGVAKPGFDVRLYAGLYAALVAATGFTVWLFIRLAGKLRTHVSFDIRAAGFDRLQELTFSYYDRRPVGWLMARMTSDCERLSNILAWGVLDLFWGTTVLASIAVVMFLLEWKLALAVLTVLPVLGWISAIFRRRILETARVVRKTNSRITASYNEGITGERTSKVFVRESENAGEFGALADTMFGASVKNALHSAVYLPLVLSLGSIATGVALAAGGLTYVTGGLTVGTLIAFMAYTRHFFDPVNELAHWFAEMQMAQASAERILGLIDEVPEIRDSAEVRAAVAAAPERKGLASDGLPDRIERIEFRGVTFRYQDGPAVKALSAQREQAAAELKALEDEWLRRTD